MIELSALLERDAQIHGIVEEVMPMAIEFGHGPPIPKTVNVFLSFIASTEFIKNGIFDLVEAENIWATKILFRSLIEHFFRFQYIFFRACEEKGDGVAEDYLKFSSFKEGLLIGKSWKRVAKILGQDSPLTPYEALKDLIPDIGSYSRREIDKRASQFDFANVLEHICGKLRLPTENGSVPFPLTMIPEYSDLSSFVHGAPAAIQIMNSMQDEGKLAAELIHTAELAFQAAGSVKVFSLLVFFQHDKRFGPAYSKITKLVELNVSRCHSTL